MGRREPRSGRRAKPWGFLLHPGQGSPIVTHGSGSVPAEHYLYEIRHIGQIPESEAGNEAGKAEEEQGQGLSGEMAKEGISLMLGPIFSHDGRDVSLVDSRQQGACL